MIQQTLHHRRGVVLLLGLILMAAIVASTIAIATAVNSSSHQSKNLDDFVLASLGADSGLERGLSVIKTGRMIGSNVANSTTASSISSTSVSSAGSTMAVSSAPTSAAVTIPQLRPFESVTFDFLGYSELGFLNNFLGGGSSSLFVKGFDAPCVTPLPGYTCNGQLEVDWIGLDSGGQPSFSGRTTIIPTNLNGQDNSVNLLSAALIHYPDTDTQSSSNCTSNCTKGFRITIRALDILPHAPLTDAQSIDRGTIKNITITPPNTLLCTGNVTCPTGVVTLTSTGGAGTSQSVKQASVLWQLPASPLFNFVLFTEGDIIPSS